MAQATWKKSQRYMGTRTMHQHPRRSPKNTWAPGLCIKILEEVLNLHRHQVMKLRLSCYPHVSYKWLTIFCSKCLSKCWKTCKQVDIRWSYNAQPKSLKNAGEQLMCIFTRLLWPSTHGDNIYIAITFSKTFIRGASPPSSVASSKSSPLK